MAVAWMTVSRNDQRAAKYGVFHENTFSESWALAQAQFADGIDNGVLFAVMFFPLMLLVYRAIRGERYIHNVAKKVVQQSGMAREGL